MRIIKYKLRSDNGPDVTVGYSEANLALAKSEAWNGDYIIEDDGLPEPMPEVTTDDILNTLLGVTA